MISRRAEVDAWMDQVKQRTEEYRAQGLPKGEAEERALADVRREIRDGPPIGSPR